MKHIILYSILLLNFICFSIEKREIRLPDYWEIISVEKDKSIKKGQSKIKLLILEKDEHTPIKGVQLFLNTDVLIGSTDSVGNMESMFPSGENKFCADTPDSNSFTANYTFLDQHYYVVKVVMDRYNPNFFNGNGLIEVADKPVIYLYPEKIQTINVMVAPKGDFLFTYPAYPTKGWNITGSPSGKIEYEKRFYNYLFWEATYPSFKKAENSPGFIVNSDTLIQFFENTLTKVGLNELEQADFITYWCPRMIVNPFNSIHFYFNDEVEKHIASLTISPTPKSIIRVFMTYHKADEGDKIKPQLIPNYRRDGFTAVEWGGSQN